MMKPANQRIAALRSAMQAAGVNAYLIPCTDPHADEYVAEHYAACNWFSGFTGESCTLAVTAAGSALWVDGRYFLQGAEELSGTEIALMRMGEPGVPTLNEWLAGALTEGQTLAFEGTLISCALADSLREMLDGKGVELKNIDLISPVWGSERPALPDNDCWLLDAAAAGRTATEKLADVRSALKKSGADALLEAQPGCIAWLLNLRAGDINCTPYAMAYCYLSGSECVLFAQNERGRFPADIRAALEADGVTLAPYGGVMEYIAALKGGTVRYAPDATNEALREALNANPNIQAQAGEDPIPMMKAVKNPGEIAATKEAHLNDAAAMVRFQMELERRLAAGETLSEPDVDDILIKYRSAQPGFLDRSFDTIAGWGPNGAVIHYHATEENHGMVGNHGFLLVDSGATYRGGTTDITRTYPVGALTEEEKDLYTLVLQCHIDTARAVWMEGATGGELDMLSRQPLFRRLLNYRHGTGHGVAHVGSVHEGPQSLRPHNPVVFRPGMVITDEPGIYEEGRVGIRIENELLVVEKGTSAYGKFLAFEPLMWVPISTEPIRTEWFSRDQKEWLNGYHAGVREKLASRLSAEENVWLAEKTQPIE